jgi:antitoxin HicB
MNHKTLNDYLSLPYTIEVNRDIDGDDGSEVWFGRVAELPGCMTEADTFAELGEMILDAMSAWIESALEDGDPVPEPRPEESFSGKFVTRVPRSLHRQLSEAAGRDGVSLNAFINVALARAVGPDIPASTISGEAGYPNEELSQTDKTTNHALHEAGVKHD